MSPGCIVLSPRSRCRMRGRHRPRTQGVLGGLSPERNIAKYLRFVTTSAGVERQFPELPVVVNGGFPRCRWPLDALTWCDGVMLGREGVHRPFVLPSSSSPQSGRRACAGGAAKRCSIAWLDASREVARGDSVSSITDTCSALYVVSRGARGYRRTLAGCPGGGRGPELIRSAAPVAG